MDAENQTSNRRLKLRADDDADASAPSGERTGNDLLTAADLAAIDLSQVDDDALRGLLSPAQTEAARAAKAAAKTVRLVRDSGDAAASYGGLGGSDEAFAPGGELRPLVVALAKAGAVLSTRAPLGWHRIGAADASRLGEDRIARIRQAIQVAPEKKFDDLARQGVKVWIGPSGSDAVDLGSYNVGRGRTLGATLELPDDAEAGAVPQRHRHQPGAMSGVIIADTPLFSESGSWGEFLGVLPARTWVRVTREGGVSGGRPRTQVEGRSRAPSGWVWSDMIADDEPEAGEPEAGDPPGGPGEPDGALAPRGAAGPMLPPRDPRGAAGPMLPPRDPRGAAGPMLPPRDPRGAAGPMLPPRDPRGAAGPMLPPRDPRGAAGPMLPPRDRPPTRDDALAPGALGAVVGGMVAGPVGAVVGGALAAVLGGASHKGGEPDAGEPEAGHWSLQAPGGVGRPLRLARGEEDAAGPASRGAPVEGGWTMVDPKWLPRTALYGIPITRENVAQVRAAFSGEGIGSLSRSLPDKDLFTAVWVPWPWGTGSPRGGGGDYSPRGLQEGKIARLLRPSEPWRGAEHGLWASDNEGYELPLITPTDSRRGKVVGEPIDPLDWSKGADVRSGEAGEPEAGHWSLEAPGDAGDPSGGPGDPGGALASAGRTSAWDLSWLSARSETGAYEEETGYPARPSLAALRKLEEELDAAWPGRRKKWGGNISDASAERDRGVLDVPESPAGYGPALADLQAAVQRDARVVETEIVTPSLWSSVRVPTLRIFTAERGTDASPWDLSAPATGPSWENYGRRPAAGDTSDPFYGTAGEAGDAAGRLPELTDGRLLEAAPRVLAMLGDVAGAVKLLRTVQGTGPVTGLNRFQQKVLDAINGTALDDGAGAITEVYALLGRDRGSAAVINALRGLPPGKALTRFGRRVLAALTGEADTGDAAGETAAPRWQEAMAAAPPPPPPSPNFAPCSAKPRPGKDTGEAPMVPEDASDPFAV